MTDNTASLEVPRVRRYLVSADLSQVSIEQAAQGLGVDPQTLRYQLERAGTAWGLEKRRERERRLRKLMAEPGRLEVRRAAQACGFLYSESFLLFFKRVMGKTYTQWRLERQAG